ncbi:MAG: hypothetical protein KAI43_05325 [Candidatus Aureabacteria bacterium]|nr:hypothetical protein [Candidatus Auribacterota bacterium]
MNILSKKDKLSYLKYAISLYNHLVSKKDNPPEVKEELMKEIEICEEKIKQIQVDNVKQIIIFSENKVEITGKETFPKNVPWISLEHLILKGTDHWLWGFVYFNEWTKLKLLKKHPKDQFFNYLTSKYKEKKRNYGLIIEHRKGHDEAHIIYDKIKSTIDCNLFEARDNYTIAKYEYEKDNIDTAIEKLIQAINPKYYPTIKYIDAYNLLINCIFRKNYINISSEILNRVNKFLRWYTTRLKQAIFIIQNLYINHEIIIADEIADEFDKLNQEEKIAERNYQAIKNKAPVAEDIDEYDKLVNIILKLKEMISNQLLVKAEIGSILSVEEKIYDLDSLLYETTDFKKFKEITSIKVIINECEKILPKMYNKEAIIDLILINTLKQNIDFDRYNKFVTLSSYLKKKMLKEAIFIRQGGKASKEITNLDLDKLKFKKR